MKILQLPWETVQAIYKSKDGEVTEGKYVRITGNFELQSDPSEVSADRVTISPVYRVVFRNLDDGAVYFASRAMRFDAEKSVDAAVFFHPFERGNAPDTFEAYEVKETKHLAGTFFFGGVPN